MKLSLRDNINNEIFNKIMVLFWAVWWLIALWTDVVGGFAHLSMIKASWAPDTNYPFLLQSLAMYPLPAFIPPMFFIFILCWTFLSALAFIWAVIALSQPREIWISRAQYAYIISLTYWLAFFIADQLVMKFDLEQNHMVQGGFELLTFFALYILPFDLNKKKRIRR